MNKVEDYQVVKTSNLFTVASEYRSSKVTMEDAERYVTNAVKQILVKEFERRGFSSSVVDTENPRDSTIRLIVEHFSKFEVEEREIAGVIYHLYMYITNVNEREGSF